MTNGADVLTAEARAARSTGEERASAAGLAPDRVIPADPSMLGLVAAFAAIYLVWGSTYLAIRVAVETMPPLLMAGTRFVIAGALLYAWLRFRGAPRPTGVHWRSAAIVGALLLLGGNGLVVWAEQTVPSGIAALLVATVPVWMVVLHALSPDGVRPRWLQVVGLLLGLAGVGVLVYPDALQAALFNAGAGASAPGAAGGSHVVERVDPWGAGALVLASLSWSIGSLYSRHAALPEAPLMATAMEMMCGGGLQLCVGGALGEFARLDVAQISAASAAAFAYLIVFGSWIGFSAYVWLLGVTTPARVATYAYVNPVVAVLLGWLILAEPLTAMTLAAMALIVTAVVLITTAGVRRRGAAGR